MDHLKPGTMKATIRFIILFAIILSQSCKNKSDPCGECFTPPSDFKFEIVDRATGEDLFKNGTFQPNQIKIISLFDSSDVQFKFIEYPTIDIIQTQWIGATTETIYYSFSISSMNIFRLYIDAERIVENCCSYTRYNEIRIEDVEYETNPDSEIIKILVNL